MFVSRSTIRPADSSWTDCALSHRSRQPEHDVGKEDDDGQANHLDDHEVAHPAVDQAQAPLRDDVAQVVRRHRHGWRQEGRLQVHRDQGAEPDQQVELVHAELEGFDDGQDDRQEDQHDRRPFERPAQQEHGNHDDDQLAHVGHRDRRQGLGDDLRRPELGEDRAEHVGRDGQEDHHARRHHGHDGGVLQHLE